MEANTLFLEKHKGHHHLPYLCAHKFSAFDFAIIHGILHFADSLMHRAAVAEMLHVLDPSNKAEAVKLLEDSSDNLVSG